MVNLSYYLIPVRGTPFGLGLALPTGYGHTRVNYSQELSQRLYNPQLTEEYCNKVHAQHCVVCGYTWKPIILL